MAARDIPCCDPGPHWQDYIFIHIVTSFQTGLKWHADSSSTPANRRVRRGSTGNRDCGEFHAALALQDRVDPVGLSNPVRQTAMTVELKWLCYSTLLAGSLWIPFIVGVNLTKFEGKDELFVRPPDHSKMPLRSRPPLTDDLRKPLLPIRARRLPTQLPLGLRVRARPSLGHHDHQVLPAHQANHPSGYRSRLLRSEHHRQSGQPGTYLCGLIIDDVVDTS